MTEFNPAWLLLLIPLAAVALKGKKKDKKPPTTGTPNATGWWIGPIIPGYGNYSVNMPAAPTPAGAGWRVDLGRGQELDAVIRRKSLAGKRVVTLRIRVEGTGIRAAENTNPPHLTFMFQRKGDDWSARGAKNFYRWYARKRIPLTPGEHEVSIDLVRSEFGHVTKDTEGYTEAQKDAFFAAALRETDNIACAMGSAGGASHGIRSDTPASITLLSIEIL